MGCDGRPLLLTIPALQWMDGRKPQNYLLGQSISAPRFEFGN
jgi:hypothetical protein